jgi:cbb3-type cytochrome oxidase subunit 3
MTLVAFSGVLAQHGGHESGSSTGELVMTIFLATVLSLIWIALGVVCWIFWRAKKREDEAKARADLKETEWRSAHSS